MPTWAKQWFSGEIDIGEDSFLYHRYKLWQENGGSTPYGYKENFCHYVRVAFLWSTKRWLFNKLLDASGFGVGVTCIVALYAAWIIAMIAGSIANSAVAGLATAVIVSVAWILLLVIFRIRYVRDPKGFEAKTDKNLETFADWLEPKAIKIDKAIKWFFTSRKFKVVFPWNVTLVAALVASILLFGTGNVSYALLCALALVVIVVIGAVALIAIGLIAYFAWNFVLKPFLRWLVFGLLLGFWDWITVWLFNHVALPFQAWNHKRNVSPVKPAPVRKVKVVRPPEPTRKRWNPFTVMVEILGAIARAIYYHRVICPLINLPGDPVRPAGKSPLVYR